MWRSVSLLTLAGILLLALCGERFTSAREEKRGEKEGTPPEKKTPTDYGLVEAEEDKATYPSDKLGAPPKGFDEKKVASVIPYELLGGPIIFHGTLYVMEDKQNIFTDGTVSRGPNGGPFFGKYRLTKSYPRAYIYDTSTLLKRHRLEIVIDYDCQLVAYREQWRSLGVWYAENKWHILVTW
jgi:hypothetical protein